MRCGSLITAALSRFANLAFALTLGGCNTIEVPRAPIPIPQPVHRDTQGPGTLAAPGSQQPSASAEQESPPQRDPAPLSEAESIALLRGYLLQLLPCEPGAGSGQVPITATLAEDGAVLAMRAGYTTLSRDTVRCVLARVSWWHFPAGRQQRNATLTVSFPLQPPSINDHLVVLLPGGGQIDQAGTTAELRKLRPKVMSCFEGRKPDPTGVLLVWLRLGEWGKLLDSGVEADTGNPAKFQQTQEKACLHHVLRYGAFPNPTGDVELRFPYVLTR